VSAELVNGFDEPARPSLPDGPDPVFHSVTTPVIVIAVLGIQSASLLVPVIAHGVDLIVASIVEEYVKADKPFATLYTLV